MRRTAILASVLGLALVLSGLAAAKPAAHFYRHATVYSTHECDRYSPGNSTADGSSLYSHADPHRRGVVASNSFPLGSLLRMDRVTLGHRYYTVRDTGGRGAALLDIYVPCSRLNPTWGRRVGFRVVRWGR